VKGATVLDYLFVKNQVKEVAQRIVRVLIVKEIQVPVRLLTKSHLKALRSLTQCDRCWAVIDSHLMLYDILEGHASKTKEKTARTSKASKLQRRGRGHDSMG
jgi:hypothetical protein